MAFFLEHLPLELDDRRQFAYQLVPKVMTQIFGDQNEKWETYKHANNQTTYVSYGLTLLVFIILVWMQKRKHLAARADRLLDFS